MNRNVIISSRAEFEITDAIKWYENVEKGLGLSFLNNLDKAIIAVMNNPEMYPVVFKKIRRILIKKFPYSLYYYLKHTEIIILAVFHEKRNPTDWRKAN